MAGALGVAQAGDEGAAESSLEERVELVVDRAAADEGDVHAEGGEEADEVVEVDAWVLVGISADVLRSSVSS